MSALTRSGVRTALAGRVTLAPLTRAGNLPFRRLCVELGATITCSEMVVAHFLLTKPKERVLLRRHATETLFGVQIAGRRSGELAEATQMAIDGGADYVDINFGCPIDSVVRKGYGAALLDRLSKLEELVAAVRAAAGEVPVFAKIRTGFAEGKENAVAVAKACVAGGADAITVHGRTREQRYRRPADWDRIAEVATSVDVPVIGNGDILYASDAQHRLRTSGVTAVMAARGALIQPWLFEDLAKGEDQPRSPEQRVTMMRRWIDLACEQWGNDEHGWKRIRPFLEIHVDFWRRYVPKDRLTSGEATLAGRPGFEPESELEAILSATGDDGINSICRHLLEPYDPPPIAFTPVAKSRDGSAGGWG